MTTVSPCTGATWRLVTSCLTLTFSAQPLCKISESLPLSGIHMDVLPVADILIVNDVVVNSLSAYEQNTTPSILGTLQHDDVTIRTTPGCLPKRLLRSSRKSFRNSLIRKGKRALWHFYKYKASLLWNVSHHTVSMSNDTWTICVNVCEEPLKAEKGRNPKRLELSRRTGQSQSGGQLSALAEQPEPKWRHVFAEVPSSSLSVLLNVAQQHCLFDGKNNFPYSTGNWHSLCPSALSTLC